MSNHSSDGYDYEPGVPSDDSSDELQEGSDRPIDQNYWDDIDSEEVDTKHRHVNPVLKKAIKKIKGNSSLAELYRATSRSALRPHRTQFHPEDIDTQ